MKQHKKNGEIELLRFIFSLIIVLHHSKNIVARSNRLFRKGSFGVELFFLISGYLLINSIERRRQHPSESSLADDTLQFVKRKLGGFYPELIAAELIGILFIFATSTLPLRSILKYLVKGVPSDLLLLSMTGWAKGLNAPTWYLSTMIMTFLVLYPCLRKWPDMMGKVILPLSGVLLIGALFKTSDSLLNPYGDFGLTYRANVRGFAEIALGVTAYYIARRLSELPLKNLAQTLLMLVKWGGYGALFFFMYTAKGDSIQEYYFIGLFIALCITFSRQTPDAYLYDRKLIYFLGRISLPMFLSHYFFSTKVHALASLNNIDAFRALGDGRKVLVYLGFVAGATALNMLLSGLCRKMLSSQHVKQLFLKN